ncbi:hypothetical protein [Actinokineospora sp.]|uniref:hypothetical protein n=1 Tax=Actinokineospora sp. TaxID=1872133 RepID=UPI003D6AFBE5
MTSYHAYEAGRAHVVPTPHSVEADTDEALRGQLAALGSAAAVLTALLSDAYSVRLAADSRVGSRSDVTGVS